MTNALKTPFTTNIQKFGAKKTNDALQLEGKELPAAIESTANNMVTASFQVTGYGALPQVTVGVAMSRYVRVPLRTGDTGVLRAADAVLGGITGQGTGTASNVKPGNLGALVFEHVSNTSWPALVDQQAVQVSAPHGFVLQTDDQTCSIIGNQSGLTLTFGGHTIVINSTGVIIDGKTFLIHEHSGVTIGTGVTGPVV